MANKHLSIVWFRNDLRLIDQPSLHAAAHEGSVIPLYIYEDHQPHGPGAAAKWFLQEALQDLAANLKKHGVSLILRKGDPLKILPALAEQTGAIAVHWSRCYEPGLRERDQKLQSLLEKKQIAANVHPGYLLFEPEAIKSGGGTPYKVYTPFSKTCMSAPALGQPLPAPRKLTGVSAIASDKLSDWRLVPKKAQWPQGFAAAWQPTEKAAHRHLQHFLDEILNGYKTSRNLPAAAGTSRLSPYLHHGLISPRFVWDALHHHQHKHPAKGSDAERYALELIWRDFTWHSLFHFPTILSEPFDPRFKRFKWKMDAAGLKRWQQGQTGYPIVDAGMRELWLTGWLHNRVRMIVGSFLIKDLLIDWRKGMAWFWDTLVDGDLGNNTFNWQWVAGCGQDAAPFFRIFNPLLQGKKFDPDGEYVRRYVPELAKLEKRYIHEPWNAPDKILEAADIKLGKTYPKPLVDHEAARERALLGFRKIRRQKKTKQ